MNQQDLCKLCLVNPPNVRAHILAQGLLRLIDASTNKDGNLLVLHSGGNRPLKRPGGSYDRGILCSDCDGQLGKYDQIAIDLSKRKRLEIHPAYHDIYRIHDIDQRKLKLFSMSYAWRTSLTQLPEFQRFTLGPRHEEIIRKMLLDEDPGEHWKYATLVTKFSAEKHEELFGKTVLFPSRNRLAGINTVDLYLPNLYRIILKVDQQRYPRELEALAVGRYKEMLVVDRGEFLDSAEAEILRQTVRISP